MTMRNLLEMIFEYQLLRTKRDQLDVPLDLGTPGAVNSVTLRQQAVSGGNLGPVITDVSNDPVVPGDGVAVKVRAKVYDSDGVATVTLR